jgi:hypothetical protein
MFAIDYDKISISDKFMMLEDLWENMSKNATQKGFTPSWHIDILNDREKKVKDNTSSFYDLEDIKHELYKVAK